MSSYLSSPYEITPPQSNFDLNVIEKGLSTLQGAYNTHKAAIDQALAQYNANLKGLRDSDNAYIAAKLQDVNNTIQQYSLRNNNLAYSSTKDSILTAITSVMDDPLVKDIVTSYNNKVAYDKEYAAMVAKKPDAANDANYQYGLYNSGYYSYMQGKSNIVGKGQYIPYTDLTEENLKRLKTIKDVKGKRFIEKPDPNNPGYMIRQEIDGLEAWEINQYLGSTMTSKELQQMQINAWSKFGAQNIDNNKPILAGQYQEFNNKQTERYKEQRDYQQSIINNPSSSADAKQKAKDAIKSIDEAVDDLKTIDVSKLSATDLAYRLEKESYLNGISQLAKAEWSTEYKKDDVWFANQDLDIKHQNLAIEKQKLALATAKFAYEKGIDESGQPLGTKYISQSPYSTELVKKLEAESVEGLGVGQGTLVREHNDAYNNILSEASNFLTTANVADVNTVKSKLALNGIEVVGNTFRFKNPTASQNRSIVNEIYQAFKETGNVTPTMYSNNEIKLQKSKELVSVQSEGYSRTFNANAREYIKNLRVNSEELTSTTSQLTDFFGRSNNKEIKAELDRFVNKVGGWNNMEDYLKKNPKELTKFADLTDKVEGVKRGIIPSLREGVSAVVSAATSPLQGLSKIPSVVTGQVVDMPYSSLRRDAKRVIEQDIQAKTKSGAMMSAYNQFNIIDAKLKKNILASVVEDEIQVSSGGVTNFNPNQNVTIRKVGDKIFVEQTKISGSGDKESARQLRFEVSKLGDLYGTLSKYIDLQGKKSGNYIQAERDTEVAPMRVKLPSSGESETNETAMYSKVQNAVPDSAKTLFASVGGYPGLLGTKESASTVIDNVMKSLNVSNEKAALYKQKLLNNIDYYKINPVVKFNYATNRNEFALEVLNGDQNRITDGFLGTDKLPYDMKYSMEMYPQVYAINQLLLDVAKKPANIDSIINKL